MTRALKAQLKSLRATSINPRQEWVVSNRATLLAQIKNSAVFEKKSVFETVWLSMRTLGTPQFVMRPLAVLLVVAMSVSSWVATSRASQGSLPGDALYPVKLATEKTQLAWVAMLNDKTKTAQLHVELAGRRADEAKKIVFTAPEKRQKVLDTVTTLKQELAAANENLHDIKQLSAPTLSQDVVTAIQQQTDDIKKSLQAVKVSLQTSSTTADKLLSEQVAEARNSAKDTDVVTVQTAVADHLKSNSALSKDYVNALIDATVERTVAEAGATAGNVTDVKTAVVEAVRDLTATGTVFRSTSTIIVVESTSTVTSSVPATDAVSSTSAHASSSSIVSTNDLKQTIAAVADEAREAVTKTHLATTQLSQKATEIKLDLTTGDLVQAVAKIQEITDASKEVEKIADATIIKVQSTLPDVVTLVAPSTTQITSTAQLKEKIGSILKTPSSSISSTLSVTTTLVSTTIDNVTSSVATSSGSGATSSGALNAPMLDMMAVSVVASGSNSFPTSTTSTTSVSSSFKQ